MWIKEQESRFCNEFTANPFYISILPSKAQFRRQHFTSAHQLWARLVTPHPAQLVVNTGAGKTPNWPPPLLWQSQIPFQEKPNPISHCWLLEIPSKCKPWRQHSSTSPRDNKDTTPTSEAALQLLCAPLGTNYSLYCRLVIPNPCSLQWLLHGSAFCELPCPYQLLRKPLAICCQACFETGLFNQEVNILYYCGFRIIIIYFKKQDKRQLRSEKSAWCSYLFIKLKCY